MRILAIDPGYERLGIAILDRDKKTRKELLVYSECFKTKSSLPFEERLVLLGNKVLKIIEEYKPKAAAIETLFFTTNQKTAMRVAEARGTLLYVAKNSGLEIYEYTPLQIKIAVTGYGKATKQQVGSLVTRLIALNKKVVSDDEMDAIAIGITCLAHVR